MINMVSTTVYIVVALVLAALAAAYFLLKKTFNPITWVQLDSLKTAISGSVKTEPINFPMASGLSKDGKYQTTLVEYIDGSHILTSSDYGSTWTDVKTIIGNYSGASIPALSDDGKVQVVYLIRGTNAPVNDYMYTSSNYGASFSMVPLQTNNGTVAGNLCISGDGKTIIIPTTNGIYIYTEQGFRHAPETDGDAINAVCCSTDGMIQYGASDSGLFGVYKSTDSGLTWTNANDPLFGESSINSVCCSSDGKYVSVCMQGNASLTVAVCYSSDYGQSWTAGNLPNRNNYYWEIICDATGKNQMAVTSTYYDPATTLVKHNNTNNLSFSIDYGATWTYVSTTFGPISMSGNAGYVLAFDMPSSSMYGYKMAGIF